MPFLNSKPNNNADRDLEAFQVVLALGMPMMLFDRYLYQHSFRGQNAWNWLWASTDLCIGTPTP
jgi:hypothetical protein